MEDPLFQGPHRALNRLVTDSESRSASICQMAMALRPAPVKLWWPMNDYRRHSQRVQGPQRTAIRQVVCVGRIPGDWPRTLTTPEVSAAPAQPKSLGIATGRCGSGRKLVARSGSITAPQGTLQLVAPQAQRPPGPLRLAVELDADEDAPNRRDVPASAAEVATPSSVCRSAICCSVAPNSHRSSKPGPHGSATWFAKPTDSAARPPPTAGQNPHRVPVLNHHHPVGPARTPLRGPHRHPPNQPYPSNRRPLHHRAANDLHQPIPQAADIQSAFSWTSR